MEFAKVIKDDSSVSLFAKMQCEGHGTGFEKHNWIDVIKARALDLYGETISPERAFTKTITEDPTGQILYKALRAAPGSEIKPEPVAKVHDVVDQYAGMPEHQKFHSGVVDHMRAHDGISYQGAFSYLYTRTDPASVARRERLKAEHLQRTLTIQQAQNLEPAPAFPGRGSSVG